MKINILPFFIFLKKKIEIDQNNYLFSFKFQKDQKSVKTHSQFDGTVCI